MDSIDIFLTVAYVLIGVGAVVAILMPLIKSLDNPKSLVKTGVGVVVLGVLFFIAFSTASSEIAAKYMAEPFSMTETSTKFVGGTLVTTYVLALAAIAGIVITELNKAIK
jgi:NADH:ubiquinone oxidoreductase subunit 6 (subunit J)